MTARTRASTVRPSGNSIIARSPGDSRCASVGPTAASTCIFDASATRISSVSGWTKAPKLTFSEVTRPEIGLDTNTPRPSDVTRAAPAATLARRASATADAASASACSSSTRAETFWRNRYCSRASAFCASVDFAAAAVRSAANCAASRLSTTASVSPARTGSPSRFINRVTAPPARAVTIASPCGDALTVACATISAPSPLGLIVSTAIPACWTACAVIATVSGFFFSSLGAAVLPLAASVAAGSLAVQRAIPKPPSAATIATAAAPPRKRLSFIIDHLRKSSGPAS
ncbi:hypothetical protein D9M73_100210 [compost metagenome]